MAGLFSQSTPRADQISLQVIRLNKASDIVLVIVIDLRGLLVAIQCEETLGWVLNLTHMLFIIKGCQQYLIQDLLK